MVIIHLTKPKYQDFLPCIFWLVFVLWIISCSSVAAQYNQFVTCYAVILELIVKKGLRLCTPAPFGKVTLITLRCWIKEERIHKICLCIKAKVINKLSENKSGLQTKSEGNTSTTRGNQRNNRNTEVQQNQTPTHIEQTIW